MAKKTATATIRQNEEYENMSEKELLIDLIKAHFELDKKVKKIDQAVSSFTPGLKALSKTLSDIKPKKPKSAFIVFSSERSPEISKASGDQKLKIQARCDIIAKEWADMSAEDRKKYNNLAELDRKRYDTEMVEYKKKMDIIIYNGGISSKILGAETKKPAAKKPAKKTPAKKAPAKKQKKAAPVEPENESDSDEIESD
jgi:hypothetical protein